MKTISDYLHEIKRTSYLPEDKKILLEYMSRREFLAAASTARIRDWVKDEKVPDRCRLIFSDGEFEWESTETYHLEKYDLELSDEFVQHVLRKERR